MPDDDPRHRPPPYSTDLEVLANEVEITVYRASGPGGQHRNTTDSAVRVHHPPSGVTVVATEHRSQLRNRTLAMERLAARLAQLNYRPKKRRPTTVPAAVRRKRLEQKRLQGDKKRMRGRPEGED